VLDGFQIKVADLSAPEEHAASPVTATPSASASLLNPARAARALQTLGEVDGVLGCALVDSGTGLVLAQQSRDDQPLQLELAAATSTQVLRSHQQSSRDMGLTAEIDEVTTSAGPRHHVIRAVKGHRGLFIFVLLDKHLANLSLARYKLMEAEQSLG
jgi:predicted regulator of Ras-like GTPase activity (Roadblock/LC7/MglB family)